MILSDKEILWRLETGIIKIEPFARDNLHACSYDLRIGRILDKYGELETGLISPGMAVALTSEETIGLPATTQIAGLVSMRSGPSRKGVLATFSHLVDPGYEGKLNFVIWPLKPLTLSLGDSLFQIVFIRTGEILKPWLGKSKSFGAEF